MKLQLLFMLAVALCLGGCLEDQQDIGPEVRKKEATAEPQGLAISEIMAELAAYNGKEVVVAGKVMPGLAFEFISEQPYQIIQGESLLWVITGDVAPAEGEFVTVRGKIASPYQIKGRSYHLVLLEEERL